MLHTILFGGALAAVTMALHAAGLAGVLVVGTRLLDRPPTRFWPMTWLLIRLTVMATVFLSIFAHGFSALPGIKLYARKIKALPPGVAELEV